MKNDLINPFINLKSNAVLKPFDSLKTGFYLHYIYKFRL